jgi:hypothetical protein
MFESLMLPPPPPPPPPPLEYETVPSPLKLNDIAELDPPDDPAFPLCAFPTPVYVKFPPAPPAAPEEVVAPPTLLEAVPPFPGEEPPEPVQAFPPLAVIKSPKSVCPPATVYAPPLPIVTVNVCPGVTA